MTDRWPVDLYDHSLDYLIIPPIDFAYSPIWGIPSNTYTAALRATNLEEFTALRKHMQKRPSRRPDSPITQAVWLWATREPITVAQATLVAQRFGVSIEDIARDREIVLE